MRGDGALESGSLPRTIEDAITLTKKLGRRYLWVDALCINQGRHLTPEEAKEKKEQLNIMHLIYQCAAVAIVALSGSDSNANPMQSVGMEFLKGLDPEPESASHTPRHLRILNGGINTYTRRGMTKEEDSLNAFLGILTATEKRLFLSGFVCGLPLRSHPQSLAWFHDRKCSPRRRLDFPSWSWAGWEGEAMLPEMLQERINERRVIDPSTNLTVQLIGAGNDEKEIIVEGWVVTLEIRTDPFSEAFKVGDDRMIGSVTDRNFNHNNTIPSGTYDCLVVQRVMWKLAEDLPQKQQVFLLLLDRDGHVARRKTLVTLTPFLGGEFMLAEPKRGTVRLI